MGWVPLNTIWPWVSLSLCLSLGLCNEAMERQSKSQEEGPLFQGQHHSHIWTWGLDSVNDR